jgi:glycosyltransferase involved in cell wall biosynthesis
MARPLRILYAAGPGDVLGTYRHWKSGRDDPSQVSMTYSGQFYDIVRTLGARAHVIASNPHRGRLRDGPFTIEHRPIPFQNASGALYHLRQVCSAVQLLWRAILFRADVLVVVDGTAHWFALRAARWLGVAVVPTIHCVLWPKGGALRGVPRLVAKVNRKFFARGAAAIMSASHDITRQITEVARGRPARVFEFLPTYRREQFADVGAPPPGRSPFRVLFAGRIERNKGVFDLLEIARRFDREGRRDIEFDLCGAGGALGELRGAVSAAGVQDRFRLHGHCDKPTMRRMFNDAHVVIVPTTTEFLEGFNQVVAEGVLSGRPVITSSICPALDYVRDAAVEVPPDDVRAYGDAILKLRNDPSLYESKVANCQAAQAQFYDPDRSWGETFLNVLRFLGIEHLGAMRTRAEDDAPRVLTTIGSGGHVRLP